MSGFHDLLNARPYCLCVAGMECSLSHLPYDIVCVMEFCGWDCDVHD